MNKEYIRDMHTDLEKYRKGAIYFIGCGGAGMSGLALITHELGFAVSGSDLAENENVEILRGKGIPVVTGHSPSNLPELRPLLVVRSSAVADDNPEYIAAAAAGAVCMKRGEMLALLASIYPRSVAVTGTHGKTSVTALIVHILKMAGGNPGFMIGGKVNGWETSASAGDGKVFVTESDESDGTQVWMHPSLLAVTNIEGDHSWTLGGEEQLFANFAEIASNSGKVIYNPSEKTEDILAAHPAKFAASFNSAKFADMNTWGEFQKENANIAAETAVALGINRETAFREVRSFPGVARRMSIRYENDNIVLIEDYAHHPTEVRAALSALRERFPDFRLTVIFQPHRFARLAKYIHDFAHELRRADKIIVVPVFAAWSESGGVNEKNLAEEIGENAVTVGGDWRETAKLAVSQIMLPEVIAVFGAGDVEDIIPEIISELERPGEFIRSDNMSCNKY